MVVKVYSYMEGMEAFSDDEIFFKLPNDMFDKTLTTNITERLENSEQPWAKALINLNIGRGLLAHKKDVLIRDDLENYSKIKDNYTGVLFLDFNKLVKDVTKVIEFINKCDDNKSIGSLVFDDNMGLEQHDIIKYRTRTEMCNAFIYVPNSRFEEFHKLFTLGLKSSARHLVETYDSGKKRMSMMHLGYKLSRTSKCSSNEHINNTIAFEKFCKDWGIDYGLLQRTNFNKLYGEPKTIPNVMCIMIGSEFIESNGITIKIQGNSWMRFLRNGLPKDNPWEYTSSSMKRVTRTDFQKQFRKIQKSTDNLQEKSETIGKKFIEDLRKCI